MSNLKEQGTRWIPGRVEEVDLARVGGDDTGKIKDELDLDDLTENQDWLREFMGEQGRVFITENNRYMFVKPEDSEIDFPTSLMTPEEAEATYTRTSPFLHDLYAHCSKLSVEKRLKAARRSFRMQSSTR